MSDTPSPGSANDSDMSGDANKPVHIRRRSIPHLAPALHTNALVHRLLAARGVRTAAELDCRLQDLPRPDRLLGIDLAVDRLLRALDRQERITVLGDYDCDGATSTALAVLALRALGFTEVRYLVPNRFTYGYGLSPAIVDVANEHEPHLLLTVDNGVASVDGVERARSLGIDVIVTDHHLPPAVLPRAVAIVNPNIPGATFPSRNLAGVGVIFYVMLALRASMLARGQTVSVNMAEFLDLVAIGTIADVVPLDAINRTLVEQGLRRVRAGRTRPGVLALLSCAGRDARRLVSTDIGFALGPRLNAAGRIADMHIGIECLLSVDEEQARQLATELDQLNQERRQLEKDMKLQAELQLAERALDDTGIRRDPDQALVLGVVLFEEQWHQGIIGVLAGRIKDRLHRPVIVFTAEGDSHIKGSARSIPGVHIRDVLDAIATEHPGLIDRFGGHAMAAGLTIPRAGLARFASAFDTAVSELLGGQLPAREWLSDGSLDGTERTLANAELLESLLPWGQGFEPPLFDDDFLIESSREVGTGHLKLTVRGAAVNGEQQLHDAIAFNQMAEYRSGERVRMVYGLAVNVWRASRTLQLMVRHIERA